jgi:hypothetical protein
MIWMISHRADQRARILADAHYSRQKIGTPQFVPPGRCLVLYAETGNGKAYWVTSWPFAEYTKHAWAGAWVCSAFGNEGVGLSSELIRQAVAATRWHYPKCPDLGMITFVDAAKVRQTNKPGWCFRKAGFKPVGHTGSGLLALQLLPDAMPPPDQPRETTADLFATV